MSQQEVSLPPLALSRTPIVGDNAFDGDKLGRRELAGRLTSYIDRLREGAVLAIDAPWGEGKTWFGRNWAKHLEVQGHKVVFIDAFEHDYIEDPFLLISAEISEVLDDGQGSSKGLREKAAGVMKAILPVSTKALINLAGRAAIGSSDLAGDFKEAAEAARDDVSEVAMKWVEKKLEEFSQEKASLQHFRVELARFATAQERPVVFFIDELDRCRPVFAVRLIERLKHFFDVPNLVFVLLLNRDQLEQAVKGVYGPDTQATIYLGKFVNFFFRLPKRTSYKFISDDHIKVYIDHVFSRYEFGYSPDNKGFNDTLAAIATGFNLSLRDIEKAVALYAFAQPVHFAHHILAYFIVLKIKEPNIYVGMINNNIDKIMLSEKIIADIVDAMTVSGITVPRIIKVLQQLHKAQITGFKEVGEELDQYLKHLWQYHFEVENLFSMLAQKIDIPLEV
jgi:hypothetical protein